MAMRPLLTVIEIGKMVDSPGIKFKTGRQTGSLTSGCANLVTLEMFRC